jgi:OmpA-OmpF porin, OOP family
MNARHRLSPWFAGIALLCASGAAHAQAQSGFAIDRFEPSDRGSEWFVLESVDWSGSFRPALGLVADFANRPLVVYDRESGDARNAIVENQLFFHVGGSVTVIDRLRFALSLPIVLTQSGELGTIGEMTFTPPDTTAIGDLRLSAAVRALGRPGGAFNLGFGVSVFLPTGNREQYSGDEEMRILPHVLLGGRDGMIEYGVKLGFHYRGLETDIDSAPLGSELIAAASLGVRLVDDKLLLGPELYGSTVVSESDAAFERRTTPIEALLGAHYSFGGWRVRGGVGAGLSRGLGSPTFRAVAGLEWTASEEPSEPADRDRDTVLDFEDECPDVPGLVSLRGCPPPADRDGDGVLDDEDACPDTAGVRTEDPATNGCPPPASDRDGDGVPDTDDACPDTPGVRTDDPATNGCPPPPPDRDGDTVIDADDACPDIAGLVTNDPRTNGCPPVRVDVEKKQIIILEQIKFKFNSAIILPESETILLAIREILSANPGILRVRLEGHTDSVGSDRFNKNLSRRRAQAVVTWLVKNGIQRKRLYAVGFGEERPIDSNDTEEGRQNNRRVEFHIERQEEPAPAIEVQE